MKYHNKQVHAFTTYGEGYLRALTNPVYISEAHNPASPPNPAPKSNKYDAIWDTGATNTSITQKVVSDLGLTPSGITKVSGVHGAEECSTYFVNVYLPNNVVIVGVRVSELPFTGGDVLIGMDIIRRGDFAISNNNGRTIFSFRVPTIEEIDFLKEINDEKKKFGPKLKSPNEKRKLRNKRKANRKKKK